MKIDQGFQSLGDLFNGARQPRKKPPAYQWQDMALTIIRDLAVPGFKRSSVFKVAKDLPKEAVISALNDTKELCQTGEKWKYFFKIVDNYTKGGDEKK